jgi:hypothetical protein
MMSNVTSWSFVIHERLSMTPLGDYPTLDESNKEFQQRRLTNNIDNELDNEL